MTPQRLPNEKDSTSNIFWNLALEGLHVIMKDSFVMLNLTLLLFLTLTASMSGWGAGRLARFLTSPSSGITRQRKCEWLRYKIVCTL